jgi:hypothetical protein
MIPLCFWIGWVAERESEVIYRIFFALEYRFTDDEKEAELCKNMLYIVDLAAASVNMMK